MKTARIIHFADRRAQRLGFAKHVIHSASTERPSTFGELGAKLMAAVTKTYEVAPSEELVQYARIVFTEQHYPTIRESLEKALALTDRPKIALELQDIYLSSGQLPSKRGRLVAKDWPVLPKLAVALGFLSADTCLLTSRGRLLRSIIASEELGAFGIASETNPLVLSAMQRVVFLYSFVEMDGDLLRLLYPSLIQRQSEITDVYTGDVIGEQLQKLVRTGGVGDKSEVFRLREIAEKIIAWKGKPYSGKGTRDEWGTLRLEPFVDMGVFSKKDPFSYQYEVTTGGLEFMRLVCMSDNLSGYLEQMFVGSMSRLLNLPGKSVPSDEDLLVSLSKANETLRNLVGYSDITDTCLLACMNCLFEKGQTAEIARAVTLLRQAQRDDPVGIHFNVDRWGKLKFVSFRKPRNSAR